MTQDRDGLSAEALRAFGESVDFGRTSESYAQHRAGFPAAFFELLFAQGYAKPGQRALDLGTGTGTIARGLAGLGLQVTGLDPAQDLTEAARALDSGARVSVEYVTASAEQTGLKDNTFDLITAGQCWHWFDRPRAAAEAARLLTPGGRLVIAHFDWLPLPGSVVAATETLILQHNPAWAGAGGTGIYPAWLSDMSDAGFHQLETRSFDVKQPYSHVAWRGRIQASAGVAASLSPSESDGFDQELADMLNRSFPEDPLHIPHRVWLVTGVI